MHRCGRGPEMSYPANAGEDKVRCRGERHTWRVSKKTDLNQKSARGSVETPILPDSDDWRTRCTPIPWNGNSHRSATRKLSCEYFFPWYRAAMGQRSAQLYPKEFASPWQNFCALVPVNAIGLALERRRAGSDPRNARSRG